MDNGEFIYIIIIATIILKGIIDVVWKRTLKKAEVLPPFDPSQKPQPTAPQVPPKKRKNKRPAPVEQVPVYTGTSPVEQPSMEISAPGIKEVKSEPEETDNAPLVQLQNADDLKRAVIYSEILNRKYT